MIGRRATQDSATPPAGTQTQIEYPLMAHIPDSSHLGRRSFLTAASAALAAPAFAQQDRDFSGQSPQRYTDTAFVALDPSFQKYVIGNTPLQRLWTGAFWAEGPAWNGAGKYLVWSDIPNNRQLRWIEDDGHVSVIHSPSDYSNGNTFDFQGRQLSCQHLRRVVRYEQTGAVTVIADKFNGKQFNSPNDIVVHPDGGIWFTDPTYGIQGNYEGFKAASELKDAVYRVDSKTGKIDKVTDELDKPNGICFSPDYKKVYICDTGARPDIQVFDLVDGTSLRGKKQFSTMKVSLGSGIADGIRADVDGNIWAGAGRGGPKYDGVHCIAPSGQTIGAILLPEICANICFGGTKRNHLFMCASQSLYAIYVNTTGAHIA
jgi:gluconolactonase